MATTRLFQSRNISPTTNKVPCKPPTYIHLPSNYTDNFETHFYHSQIKPFLYVLRWLGALPIEIRKSGAPRFYLLSPAVAYSACVYALVIASAYCSITDRVFTINSRRDFDYKIYNALHIYVSGSCIFSPIAIAIDAKKFVRYINEWAMLQTLFHKVTGQGLTLSVRKQCVCYAVLCCLGGIANIFFHFYEPFVSIWALPSYMVAVILSETVFSYWMVNFHCLFTAGRSFYACFKTNLEQGNLSAEMVGEYRVLWLRLSELISGTGKLASASLGLVGVATESMMAMHMAWILFGLVMCVYGLLFGINSGHSGRLLAVTLLGFLSLLIVLQFYSICSKADCIVNTVGTEVQKQLQLLATWRMRQDTQQEVNNFLGAISMNPPVISVLGFMNVNRRLFTSYASAILTYLIVLLQLKM